MKFADAFERLLADPSDEALNTAVAAVRADPVTPDQIAQLKRLVDETHQSEHSLLLTEALHRSGRFEAARRHLREARRGSGDHGRFDALLKRHLPRYQERTRFYSCERTLGFRKRDVLEVGGKLPRDFIAPTKPASWTCLDLTIEEDIDEPGYRLVRGDAADIPLPDGCVDLVFSSSAFEHIGDLPAALAEMHRVLRPGGIVFSDFSPIWSCADGHHLRGAGRATLQQAGMWPLRPWSHLTLSRDEMRDHLSRTLDDRGVETVERWLYERKSLNRLFFDDYVRHFQESALLVQHERWKPGPEPDTATLRLLARRQPGRSHFHVNGFRVMLERPRLGMPPTPEERRAVKYAIRREMGTKTTAVARLSERDDRPVYLARLPDREVVVKFLKPRFGWPVGCHFAVGALRAAEVPTPRVLSVGRVDGADAFTGHPFVILERARGIRLDQWRLDVKPATALWSAVLGNVGRHLRALHAIRTPGGFGQMADDGDGRFPTWVEYFKEGLILHASGVEVRVLDMRWHRKKGFVSREEAQLIDALFHGDRDAFSLAEPRLVHNDLTLKNVLIDPVSHEITAILDLHNTLSGDPLLDLARFHYFYRGRGYEESLLEGYGKLSKADKERIRLYLVYVLLEKLVWVDGQEAQFPGRLDADRALLKETLAALGD